MTNIYNYKTFEEIIKNFAFIIEELWYIYAR